MSLLDWMTRNWADTDEGRDPSLKPLDLAIARDEAIGSVESVVNQLRRWRIESADAESGTIHATRTTRICHFVDDVTIRFEVLSDEQTRVHARSKSRVGKGDLGQNRRNILELFRAIQSNG